MHPEVGIKAAEASNKMIFPSADGCEAERVGRQRIWRACKITSGWGLRYQGVGEQV
jgi:hypothetical protein